MQLRSDLLNLVELALDIPLSEQEEAAIEIQARYVVGIGAHSELENLKQLKIRALIAGRVNKIKEGNG